VIPHDTATSLPQQEDKERDRISRLLMYLNNALAMENASTERLQRRIKETDIEELKITLQKHLQETRQQQQRLEEINQSRWKTHRRKGRTAHCDFT
jgi:ferritin-like metal-binding protein YciE